MCITAMFQQTTQTEKLINKWKYSVLNKKGFNFHPHQHTYTFDQASTYTHNTKQTYVHIKKNIIEWSSSRAWNLNAPFTIHEGSHPGVILADYKLISAQGTAVKPPYILIASIIGYSAKWRPDDNGTHPMTVFWYKALLGLIFECTKLV